MTTVTVFTRQGCHLCEVAIGEVEQIATAAGADWRVVDVDADLDDRAEYGDRVPVILVDGVEHGSIRVEPERLRRALIG